MGGQTGSMVREGEGGIWLGRREGSLHAQRVQSVYVAIAKKYAVNINQPPTRPKQLLYRGFSRNYPPPTPLRKHAKNAVKTGGPPLCIRPI